VVAKLQVFCSEDLGAFYLDVLKDRLYTTAPNSRWRAAARRPRCGRSRRPCCAGWRPSSASPPRRPGRCSPARRARASIFFETYWPLPAPDEALLAKWARLREIRDVANKEIETVRTAAPWARRCRPRCASPRRRRRRAAALAGRRPEVRLHHLARRGGRRRHRWRSRCHAERGGTKCERCWHWRDDVGHDPAHPTICGRCTSNLHGAGEVADGRLMGTRRRHRAARPGAAAALAGPGADRDPADQFTKTLILGYFQLGDSAR
jgi:isoleucyl-tRNA synthetase